MNDDQQKINLNSILSLKRENKFLFFFYKSLLQAYLSATRNVNAIVDAQIKWLKTA